MATILRITAKRAGFRKAGIPHPASPVDHPIERFTPEQVAGLEAEPWLVVQRIEVDEAPAKEPEPRAPTDDAPAAEGEADGDEPKADDKPAKGGARRKGAKADPGSATDAG